jgi:hypothetical protein
LKLAYHQGPPEDYFDRRTALLNSYIRRAISDPPILLRICRSLRNCWSQPPEGFTYDMMLSFMLILHRSITHILQEISIKLFKSRALPIGVDKSNNFITRPVKLLDLGWQATQNIFAQLSLVLALPQNSILPLWNEGESLFTHSMAGAFPTVENPFRVGSELLVNAYGSKVYAVPHPSEVILGSGELKSIVFMEVPTVGIIYKVRYQDDCISFGQLGLRGTTEGELIFDFFPTGTIFDYVTGRSPDRDFDRTAALDGAIRQGGVCTCCSRGAGFLRL